MKKRRKGFYSISIVAKMFDVHQQTIRLYEKEGLISPKRTAGNTRLFSEEDVDRLEEVIYLTHQVGVNLAGVEMVLKLQKKIKKLQGEINTLFEHTQKNLDDETEKRKEIVKKHAKRLVMLKANHPITTAIDSTTEKEDDEDDWEVEYED